jgi:hypothetical protein
MKQHRSTRPLLSVLALAALLCAGGTASAQGNAEVSAQVPENVKRLASNDAQEQRARWGDLALVAGKNWLSAPPGDAAKLASMWRIVQWTVPGAAMRFQRGFCVATRCLATDYAVYYNAETKQLDFFEKGEKAYTSRIGDDGSVRLVGTGLVGVLTTETLKFDAATGILNSEKHELRPATAAQLAEATGGFTGAVPKEAASGSPSEELMRAEMATMKAQIEALQKQLQNSPKSGDPSPATPATATTAAATPAAATPAAATPAAATTATAAPVQALSPAEQKAAQQREALEARLRDAQQRKQQAEQRKLNADDSAIREAQPRIDAARKGKEAAEARVAEARRVFDAGPAKPAPAKAP